ncbi:hypothetical protein A8990_116117 [Paenibacillus taihuensis]|uniref:Uncharacterized protein n=1 Tax=Paenibacillus taihuensis TaxID=1156355 RepID=A0A3D9RWS6_9BACL|nr:hypothetical protein [Paenibacillus taihuensis]REE83938.1 hypothetical protein A8990_116117 [Paenibacillus taihuensis]
MTTNSQNFIVVVIPLSEIKKFVLIDIIGGTALYYMIRLPMHSVMAGMIGSMIGPFIVRRSLRGKAPRKVRTLLF